MVVTDVRTLIWPTMERPLMSPVSLDEPPLANYIGVYSLKLLFTLVLSSENERS